MASISQVKVGSTTYDIEGKVTEITFNLTSGGWSGSAAPYTQTVTATGLTASSKGVVGIASSATQEQYLAAGKANLRCTTQAANSITMTAYGTKPTVNIPCVVTVWGS